MLSKMVTITLWYALTYVIVLYYGGSVCPYIDGLGIRDFAVELAGVFAAGYITRVALEFRAAGKLWPDLSVFIAMAAGLTIFNKAYYLFPVASGVKVAVGFTALGFFLAIHSYLQGQREYLASGKFNRATPGASSSIISKISAITVVSIVLSSVIIFLVVNKDLKWLAAQPPGTVEYYRPSVLREVMFVMLVLLAFLISVIAGYSRNLKLLFLNQTHTLEKVSAGDLQAYVPVISNDEFGRIAFHTNTMIDGLREKEKIQSVFGKMVSPRIAERLLGSDHNALGGEKLNVTVLMSDVRNFTTLSESITPEELVSIMNKYFTAMVEIIHRHAGEVDKFIGDGILAIFGLDDQQQGPQNAVSAATEMAAAAAKLSVELGQTIKVGLGIHYGEVIAGRIGSPDRQEFTFIGDTVNTAARLESASKDLGKEIVVSQAVFEMLGQASRAAAWQAVGFMSLKGKKQQIETFALNIL